MPKALPQTADDRLIVALDVPNALEGLKMAETLGDAVSFYKIGLGMLTGGGLALANELKQEHGKRIFLDMKLFDIGATVENAVRGLAQFDLDFLTVHGHDRITGGKLQITDCAMGGKRIPPPLPATCGGDTP